MKHCLWTLLFAATALRAAAQQPPPGDDDGFGGDLGGTATAEVVDWFPAIRSLYVEAATKGSQAEVNKLKLEPHSAESLPSEQLQWEALRKLVERKAADGSFPPYADGEPIVCGWRYIVDREGGNTRYEVEKAAPGQPILVLLRNSEGRVRFNFDVIMTTDTENKRKYLQKHVHYVSGHISIWPVNSKIDGAVRDPIAPEALAAYRGPIGEPATKILVNFDDKDAVIRKPVLDPDGNLNAVLPEWMFSSPGPGVYEMRVKYVLAAKLPGQDKETVKSVQGSIRLAFLDTLQWDVRGKFESSRQDRTTVIGKNGQ